jgi:hypothetical protein
MDLGRAATYGSIGALGVVLALLGTLGLSWIVWTDRISGAEGRAIGSVLVVVVAGVAASVVFLFVVVGAFVDRELAARGLDSSDE